MLSASPLLNKTAEATYIDNEVFLKNANCTDLACLYSLTAEQVTSAVPWDLFPFWDMSDQGDLPIQGQFDGAIAVVDGTFINTAKTEIDRRYSNVFVKYVFYFTGEMDNIYIS